MCAECRDSCTMSVYLTRALLCSMLVSLPWLSTGDSRCCSGPCPPTLADVAWGQGDADRDGIPDTQEESLARRYAPVVELDAQDWTRPSSVSSLLGALGHPGRGDTGPLDLILPELSEELRRGSSDPSDWHTYVHVYRAQGGERLYLQYWFFYPYNDGALFFDHEGDWEHVTVVLGRGEEPLGMYAARHEDNAPGAWRAWAKLRVEQGSHPRILSADGSHGSFFDQADVGWRDRFSDSEPVVWRTWEGGGLVHLGERAAPRLTFVMEYARPWGATSLLPGTSAPVGPAYQRGWCVDGDAGCNGS